MTKGIQKQTKQVSVVGAHLRVEHPEKGIKGKGQKDRGERTLDLRVSRKRGPRSLSWDSGSRV